MEDVVHYIKMRKGQVQINETILVVFVLIVIILIGLVVFFKFTSAGIKKDYTEHQSFRFQSMIATLPDIGELKCSMHGTYEDCVDLYKALLMGSLVESNKVYRSDMIGRYGFMDIRFSLVYPNKTKEVCTLAQTQNCTIYIAYSNIPKNNIGFERVQTPVSVYLPKEETYGIAILNITKYLVQEDVI